MKNQTYFASYNSSTNNKTIKWYIFCENNITYNIYLFYYNY